MWTGYFTLTLLSVSSAGSFLHILDDWVGIPQPPVPGKSGNQEKKASFHCCRVLKTFGLCLNRTLHSPKEFLGCVSSTSHFSICIFSFRWRVHLQQHLLHTNAEELSTGGRAPQGPPLPCADGVDGSSTANMNHNLTTDAWQYKLFLHADKKDLHLTVVLMTL